MTHLNGNFFWLQFKAGPVWRYFTVVPFALGASVMTLRGPALQVVVAAFVAAVGFTLVLVPEGGAFQAFGMNRARARRVVAPAATVGALIPAVMSVAAHPNVTGAAGVLAAFGGAAVLFNLCLPNDEPAARSSGSERVRFGQRGLRAELYWRRPLVYATAAGAVTGILLPLTTYIGHDWLRRTLLGLPALVLWSLTALGVERGPATARSLGIPRAAWARTSAGVCLVVNIVYALVALLVAVLLSQFTGAPAATTRVVFMALMGIAACVTAVAARIIADGLGLVAMMVFWMPTQVLVDPADPEPLAEGWRFAIAQAGVGVAIAAVVFTLYVAGRVNARRSPIDEHLGI